MSDFTYGAVRPARGFSIRRAIAGAVSVLHEMMRARASRRLLTEMDDRLLSDIGIGRGDAQHEASRSMWDLTPHRR